MKIAEIHKIKTELLKTLKSAHVVSIRMHKNYFRQLKEMLHFRFKNDLGLSEYYNFRLWDDQRYSEREKLDFVGWRKEAELDRLGNLRDFFGLVNDKFIFHTFMRSLGIPCPEIYAAFCTTGRNYGAIRTILTKLELQDFISNEISYPFFAKPNNYTGGIGVSGVRSYNRNDSKITLINDSELEIDYYINEIVSIGRDYLFQECLQTTPELEEICGNKLTTLRIISLVNQGKVNLFRIVWKLPLGQNMNDNFQRGSLGNMVGIVDRETGIVQRIVLGEGLEQEEIFLHPETGQKIRGLRIPFYEQVCDIVIKGSKALPGLRIQHWDVAICDKGPVVVEVNIYGCDFLPQVAGTPGLWDDEFRAFLREIRAK